MKKIKLKNVQKILRGASTLYSKRPELYFNKLWPNFFKTLHQNSIPTFVVSAIFKPQHYLFKSYGKWHLKILREVSHFFVQNEQSKDLLKQNNILMQIN